MQGSKIRLSPAEAALFSNAEVILTKNTVLQKTVSLLTDVQHEIMREPVPWVHHPSPKISRGENYLGLPYVILDYPRTANNEGIFFIRSMFWWGHFYSSTLQVSGEFKRRNLESLTNSFEALGSKNYFVGIHADPWIHHSGEDNYKQISSLSSAAYQCILQEREYTKIAAFWPLQEWDSAATNLIMSWKLLAGLIS